MKIQTSIKLPFILTFLLTASNPAAVVLTPGASLQSNYPYNPCVPAYLHNGSHSIALGGSRGWPDTNHRGIRPRLAQI